MTNLKHIIRSGCAERSISISQLSDLTGVSFRSIYRLMSGECQDLRKVLRVLAFFNLGLEICAAKQKAVEQASPAMSDGDQDEEVYDDAKFSESFEKTTPETHR